MSAPTPAPNAPPIPNWKDMSREEQIRMTELCNDFQSRRSMSTTTTNLSDAGTLNSTPNGFSQAAIDRKFQETKPDRSSNRNRRPAVLIQPNQQPQAQTQVPTTPIVPGHFPSPVQGRESQSATVQTSQHPPAMAFSAPAPAAQNWLQLNTPNIASLMANYKPAPTPNADRSQLLAENNAMIESVSMAWKQLAHQMGILAEEEEEEDAAMLASPNAGRGAGKKKNRTSKKDKRLASGFSRT
ncbi:hypothetical protein COL154_012295 [Colletotrichum chrysophilum]|nr:hypothetical protein COL154_012295 [Colletotrichum chrysophilum]